MISDKAYIYSVGKAKKESAAAKKGGGLFKGDIAGIDIDEMKKVRKIDRSHDDHTCSDLYGNFTGDEPNHCGG